MWRVKLVLVGELPMKWSDEGIFEDAWSSFRPKMTIKPATVTIVIDLAGPSPDFAVAQAHRMVKEGQDENLLPTDLVVDSVSVTETDPPMLP